LALWLDEVIPDNHGGDFLSSIRILVVRGGERVGKGRGRGEGGGRGLDDKGGAGESNEGPRHARRPS